MLGRETGLIISSRVICLYIITIITKYSVAGNEAYTSYLHSSFFLLVYLVYTRTFASMQVVLTYGILVTNVQKL